MQNRSLAFLGFVQLRTLGMDTRAARKAIRRRGAASRVVDLDDIVLELPYDLNHDDADSVDDNNNSKSKSEDEEMEDHKDVYVIDDFEETAAGSLRDIDQEIQDLQQELDEDSNGGFGDTDAEDNDGNGNDGDDGDDEDVSDSIEEPLEESESGIANVQKELPSSKIIDKTYQRIVDKHRETAEKREEQHHLGHQKLVKSHKLELSKKNRLINKIRTNIKIKYRRIPSNRSRLIYVDVISQMIKDYLREGRIVEDFVDEVVKAQKNERRKRGVKKQTEKEIKKIVNQIMKEYYFRIDEYFSSLIDLQLSNNLIKNDIGKINLEKNKLRMEIFNIRQEKNSVGLQLNEVRNEFKKLNREYANKDQLYKKMIELREDDSDKYNGSENGNGYNEAELFNRVNWKLDKLENRGIKSRAQLLESLQHINEMLGENIST